MSEVLRLAGALTMSTVGARVAAGHAKAAAGELTVDLSAVSEADSAALALLFDWMRAAREGGHTLSVTGVSAELRTLAALYGVDELLPAKN
ncbi:MAG: STAS domain-containing protein [Aromatoleum sp.]|uniref:STAS domain-containing protein n=1 Tax=Aromatoleum sp. TaxID=2307007 RepID=UPI002894CB38|nr:STAS domain-containing protein [Aromatoleum sp.]MDT3670840.1 STAS domain-containing protein [Aromatoleum sp.]